MPRIVDVLKDLSLDKDQFSALYEKAFDKKLTSKITTISDANLQEIKKLAKGKVSKPKKTSVKVEKEEKQVKKEKTDKTVLKSDELGGGGFLSGLGFTVPKKVVEEDEDDNNIVVSSKLAAAKKEEKKEEEKKEQIFELQRDLFEHPERHNLQENVYKPFQKSSSGTKPQFGGRPQSGTKPQFGGKPSFGTKPQFGGKPSFGTKPSHPSSQKPSQPRQSPIKKEVKIATTSANLVKKTEVFIDEKITVKEFSEKIGIPLPEVLKKLLQNKIMTSVTASLDFDTATLIADELGVIVKRKEQQMNVESFMSGDLQAILALDKESENLLPRPPIVTVMGHVDHGKTSLLDYLRKTSVATGEAGGITQSIGASMVNYAGKDICFIDTPGHQLFTNLRARGAKLTNIAVIVVAADDSVMPQTIESIGHAKDSGVPIIIAVTKIDKPGKNLDQIKQDLAKYEIIPEDWGGDVPVIGVSSKTGQGIPELLETILLQSELMDLKYNPHRAAVGVVLDAHKDVKQGVVSTIIVMTGSLKVGDIIVAYNTYGKIRRMQNWKGETITEAHGGDPIQVLGITDLPEPGRIVEVVHNEREAQEKMSLIADQLVKQSPESAVQQFLAQMQAGDKQGAELRLILKSDGSSSLEALKQAVQGVPLPKNVTIKIIHSDVGYFSDSDLSLAQASGALLLGFNISMNAVLKKKAESLKIEMKNYDIIYELTDYLTNLLQGMVEIEKHEVIIAKLEVLAVFFTKGKDMTIGGKVLTGKLKSKIKFRVLRGEDILCVGDVVSLHRNKDEVKEVGEGEECGIKVHTGKKIEIGDMLEFYEMQDIIE